MHSRLLAVNWLRRIWRMMRVDEITVWPTAPVRIEQQPDGTYLVLFADQHRHLNVMLPREGLDALVSESMSASLSPARAVPARELP
jgi:hypothetical protein